MEESFLDTGLFSDCSEKFGMKKREMFFP